MIDFFGAKESRLDDLEDLLVVLILDLVDLRAEGAPPVTDDDDEEEGFAHCIMVLRRNLLFSCSVPRPDGLPFFSASFCEKEVCDFVATVNAGRLPLDPYEAEDFVSSAGAADATATALTRGLEA